MTRDDDPTRTYLRNRPILRWMLVAIVVIGLIDFIALWVVEAWIGGSAWLGREIDGRHFVNNHGRLTEVTEATFMFARWHMISVYVTFPLALLATVLVWRQRPSRAR